MSYLRNPYEHKRAIVKIAASVTAAAVSASLLLLALVPLQPSAIANAQQKWQLQAERSEKLNAANNLKGETMKPSMIMQATARQSGINVARTNQQAGGGAAKSYAVLNVEFKSAAARTAFAAPGMTTLTAVDRFADVFIESDAAYDAVLKSPNVVAAEFATVVDAPPPPPAVAKPKIGDRAEADAIVRNGYQSVTGKGVIVAIVDTGVDFRHPDFITYDAAGKPTSRLLYLWDTTMSYQNGRGTKAPFSYPNKTSIGTLFTKDQLTAELRRATPTIPATDLNGHGTACAGIAAGNGKGYTGSDLNLKKITPGVAPEADIIAVKIDQGDDNDGLENAYLINAASEWLDKVAGAQPLVVSCSYGGQSGPHDGSQIVERHLDARYPLNKQKRAIVFAAGNEGTSPMHGGGTFSNKANARLIGWNAKEGAQVKIYFSNGDTDVYIAPATTETKYEKPVWSQNPITRQWSATIKPGAGVGGIFIYNDSGKQAEVDAYLYGGAILSAYATHTRMVGSPGTASNVITVGSYDWNDNFNMGGKALTLFSVCESEPMTIKGISCYSSQGPRRDGVVKPEIVAPGQWYAAADAKNNAQTVGWGVGMTDTTGFYREMNGTSSATPYTAGIIALMFQKKPTLTLGEIKSLLTSKVSKDPFSGTSATSNDTWGYGRLNYEAVERILGSL